MSESFLFNRHDRSCLSHHPHRPHPPIVQSPPSSPSSHRPIAPIVPSSHRLHRSHRHVRPCAGHPRPSFEQRQRTGANFPFLSQIDAHRDAGVLLRFAVTSAPPAVTKIGGSAVRADIMDRPQKFLFCSNPPPAKSQESPSCWRRSAKSCGAELTLVPALEQSLPFSRPPR